MGERKNIDRLFQEQFKDFEQAPDNRVWENIEKKLSQSKTQKKRRVVPIWYKWIGIAASIVLMIGLSIGYFSKENDSESNIPVVVDNDAENNEGKGVKSGNSKGKNNIEITSDGVVINNSGAIEQVVNVTEESNSKSATIQSTEVDNKSLKTSSKQNNNDTYATINSAKQNKNVSENSSFKNSLGQQSKNTKTLVNTNNSNKVLPKSTNDGNKSFSSFNNKTNTKVVMANTNVIEKEVYNKKDKSSPDKTIFNNKSLSQSTVANVNSGDSKIKSNNDKSTKTSNDDIVDSSGTNVDNKNTLEANEVLVENELTTDLKNEDEEEELVEDKNEEEVLPSIEEALAEQEQSKEEGEEDEEESEPYSKWNVRPNIAPVYYNSLSSGSPIDEQFKNNSKKGDVNMSYGINVSYALNKKLKLRSGINKVELGYQTQNVAVVPIQEGEVIDVIKNVSMSSQASNLNISSAQGFSVSQIPSSFQNLFDARIDQKFGYLEVPLEMSYQLSSKKLSVNLIAGMSTFFLNKNEIHAKTNSYTTYLGEANNLNKTVFSTNLGVGLNYNLSKSFSLNVEPTFKYQLNSFSNDAGNFKPYLLGVYSGLSFKF